jgi:hypothetical protein
MKKPLEISRPGLFGQIGGQKGGPDQRQIGVP